MRAKLILALSLLAISIGLKATDNAHYYKSANLHRNPSTAWFDDKHYYEIEDWLLKIDENIMYGDANSCWDKDGHSANVLNDTGAYNMLWSGQNVRLDPTLEAIAGHPQFILRKLTELAAANTDDNFATLRFDGKFEMWESNCQIRKNLKWGLFVEGRVPVRSLKIKNISYTDLSAATGPFSQQTVEWIQFKNNFNAILNEFGYENYNQAFSKSGLGDISVLLGWEDIFEYKDDDDNDVISLWLTARLGFLMPTGERIKTDYIFSMPTGYNDHWALTGSLELDIGVLPWLSIDLYGGFTWFFDDTTREARMKTFSAQNGHIFFEKGDAKEDKGTLWYLGGNVKFDHFWEGLSAIVGYSYNRQEDTELSPSNTTLFPKDTVNTDSRLHSWYTHVLHFMLDYDISLHMKKCSKWAPRINVFYDYPVDGKNSYKTDMIGAGLGIDVRW
ncbi:hypothetical protein GF385_04505 [Candidatus Dependentiae bacterium]|nr:hypothetical protein [Candidatus Dependentiae bacterium]